LRFRDIKLSRTYESEAQNILTEFYIPALTVSVEYWRASAYFSAASFFLAAQGFSSLIENGGKIKLLISNELSETDVLAFSEGYKLKRATDALLNDFCEQAKQIKEGLFHKRMDAISHLISLNKLEIKIAFREKGVFHKKIGIMFDAYGDAISFDGSSNETAAALLNNKNSEQISVFPSWDNAVSEYFNSHKSQFRNYWDGKQNYGMTKIFSFEEAEKKRLLNVIEEAREYVGLSIGDLQEISEDVPVFHGSPLIPHIPETLGDDGFEMRPHQIAALESWRDVGKGKGVLALATGAGKTITAIYAAVRLFEQTKALFLVISVPYQNLADQWVDSLKLFGISAIQCYVSTEMWQGRLDKAVFRYNTGIENFTAVVVVNRSLSSLVFREAISNINENMKPFMFIGDECHHHSAPALSEALPKNSNFRIGLSATPEHYLDQEKNTRLKEFYGDVVATYTLSQAIKDQVLTPYEYHVVPVPLTEDETEEYIMLTKRIVSLMGPSDHSEDQALTALLMRRSRLLGSAKNKIPALKKLLSTGEAQPFTLFYCGDGRLDSDGLEDLDSDGLKQIDVVTKMVFEAGYVASRFTSRESPSERRRILRGFKDKTIDALVAIKCLDEGIDIPACETAFILASSANPRQFIQRRGRILRKSKGKTLAKIFDFVVFSDEISDQGEEINSSQSNILRNELKRVAEFAALSTNNNEVYQVLRPILQKHNLAGAF
jgi:superfamily II DNA or RNA helicase